MDNNENYDYQETNNERNVRNNEDNIRNAAEVAKATGHPIASAIGTGVQIADKVSGGKSTQKLAKQLNTANKIVPGGHTAQRLLNKSNESGISSKAGDIARKKNLPNKSVVSNSNTNNNNQSQNSSNTSNDNQTRDTSNLNNDDQQNDSNKNKKDKNKVKKSVFANKKIKIIIILIGLFISICLFICIFMVPLIVLGIIDVDGITSGIIGGSDNYSDYSEISDNLEYWWPIGSTETTNINGITFATGTPSSTNITANFDGNDTVHKGSHGAIDIGAYLDNVIAVKSGTVVYPTPSDSISFPTGYYGCTDGGGFGNYVIIEHDDGMITIYGHMYENTITVRTGDKVSQGQVIGKAGSSGSSTGGHLHFEMRDNGIKVDPLGYVSIDNPRPGLQSDISNKDTDSEVENENS